MSKLWRTFRKRGFTLVELLVVIAIIGILVAIVLPAIGNALFRGKLTAVAANGRSIHQSVIGKQTEDIYISTSSAFPTGGTSTAWFANLVSNGTMSVAFSFFAAPGVPAANSDAQFKDTAALGKYNAWCVVGNGEVMPETTPWLFTRNLKIGKNTDVITDPKLLMAKDTDKGSPFQEKGLVFVTRGGSAFSLFKDDLQANRFSNLWLTAGAPTNVVLRPGTAIGTATLTDY